ncbi:MAG: 3-deoxy-manno-octulosonate cytidylyltransferase [Nitrospirae bacterium]|nr:3-deoxy-manno-octulosonate cytidylyltransferase [Nitrospirota bacterium]
MKAIVVIPARYGSTRLPGKPLLDIHGKPLIQHVYENARRARLSEKVIVATDDRRVFDAVMAFGGDVVMTSPEHPSGTDRIAEVVKDMSVEVVVNLQGDEPMIMPDMIDDVITILFEDKKADMGTLVKKIDNIADVMNPNVVKAVFDKEGFAMYFSRSPVPFYRDMFAINPLNKDESDKEVVFRFSCLPDGNYRFFKHIGIYSYRKDVLLQLTDSPPTELEIAEKLEQLRALQEGFKIKIKETSYDTVGVDTEEDLIRVRELLVSLLSKKIQ